VSDRLVVLLHLCDSLFPLGSFSHSDGLEAATDDQRVGTVEDLTQWMDATLEDTLTRLEGPAAARAWSAWSTRRVAELLWIDAEMHAMRPSSTGREASRAMGSRLLKTWGGIHPRDVLIFLPAEHPRLTLPVAFGVVAAAAGISQRDTLQGFMYTRLASTVSAAMRLMPLGQQDGHRVLAGTLARVPAAVDGIVCESRTLTSFAPLLDMAAMSQQYVRSRLFRS
jgi:urease accessory protein